ncbi:MAG TPA: hypothetical protein VM532_12325, partial [Burkholderiales bacterium]|nr:hypothetical protein [Burkholderiales bacterium]
MPREPLLPVTHLLTQCDSMARDKDSQTLAALRSVTFDARGQLRSSIENAGDLQTIHSGICHGTLGELFQGPYIRDDELHISLISLPIKKYSFVHFEYGENGHFDVD